jgi:hypothetical protein
MAIVNITLLNQKKTKGFDWPVHHTFLLFFPKYAKAVISHVKDNCIPRVLIYIFNRHAYLPNSKIWRDLEHN